MQRLMLGLLILVLCVVVVLAVQVIAISNRLDTKEQARIDLLEARVIVLEKDNERMKLQIERLEP